VILVLLIGLGLLGTAAVLVVRGLTSGGARARETLGAIDAYGFRGSAVVVESENRGRDRLAQVATKVGALYNKYAPKQAEAQIRELLRTAGLYRMRPVTFLGYRVLTTAGGALFCLWLLSVGGAGTLSTLFLTVCFGAIGWVVPVFVLRRRAASRLEKIDLEVPELVDLLVTTVEAGVGFGASLQLTARRVRGPLGEELRVALSEQSMGLTIHEALRNMLSRADTPSLRAFVQAILQGDTLGVSIGKILRDLAVDMRKRRRQSAEERAQKAPVKIIFPLVFLIFPAIFIVAVGPIVISFLHGLG
jgi:tight adherence protein C